jgi:hypothetical protein
LHKYAGGSALLLITDTKADLEIIITATPPVLSVSQSQSARTGVSLLAVDAGHFTVHQLYTLSALRTRARLAVTRRSLQRVTIETRHTLLAVIAEGAVLADAAT